MSDALIATFLSDPDWLAHRYDPDRDTVHFRNVPRATRRRVPFLTDMELRPAGAPVVLERPALHAAVVSAPLHFIFHSAFCCSTLLANALDQPGIATTLKEPVILNDMVGWLHRGVDAGAIAPALDTALGLLARPFAAGEKVIVKPSNVVNGLIPTMMGLRPDAKCILMQASLPVYLGSIARKEMEGRLWVRDLLAKQLRSGIVNLGFVPEDYLRQTDLQVAAVGWIAQKVLFDGIARRWPTRVRTLDSDALLARPEEALRAIASLFDLNLLQGLAADIARGGTFSRNAKNGRAYQRDDRVAEQRAAAALHSDELSKVTIWADAVLANAGFARELPNALI